MSAQTVPQLWVYPPGASADIRLGQTADFGPIHNGDWMILTWTPASAQPDIGYACNTPSGLTSAWNVTPANKTSSPLKVQVNWVPKQNGTSDTPYCHFWFPNSQIGNTVNWIYALDARPSASTFGAAAQLATSTVSSSATSTATSTITSTSASIASAARTSLITSTTSSTSIAAASADSTGTSQSGPSAGTSAGIGVGVALGVLALAGAGVLFWWLRRRRNRAATEMMPYDPLSQHPQSPPPQELHGAHITELDTKSAMYAKTRELKGQEVAHEMQ